MKRIIQFDLEDDSPAYIEIDDNVSGHTRVSSKGKGIERADDRFTAAIARIKPATEVVLAALHDLNTPDEIRLDFGLKFNAKAGAIFASVDSEATFKVSLKWKAKEGSNGENPI